jgi:hypothetical protein
LNLFAFNFSTNRVNIALQRALAFVIERKIALVGDVCFRSPIIIKFHDLVIDNIRGVLGEIASYHEKD